MEMNAFKLFYYFIKDVSNECLDIATNEMLS